MRLISSAGKIVDEILDICFSPICLGCEKPIHSGSLCVLCGTFSEVGPRPGDVVKSISSVRSHFWLSQSARKLVHKAKYQNQPGLFELVWDAITTPPALPPGDFCIVPVPMHPLKETLRGFNQADLIARRLSQLAGVNYLPNGLAKKQFTTSQSMLSRKERLRNLRRSFYWRLRTPPPSPILLVDDIFTTGSTLGECAKALKKAGAGEIHAWTLFRAETG